MFWKFVKIPHPNRISLLKMHRWPISLRLTLFYTLMASGLLSCAVVFQYYVVSNRLQGENLRFLKNKVLILKRIIKEAPSHIEDYPSYKDEVILEPPIDHFYSRIVDQNGKVLIETPHMNEIAPFSVFSAIMHPQEITHKVIHGKEIQYAHHKYYLLMNAPIELPLSPKGTLYYIQMAKNITAEHRIIEDLQKLLVVILLLGIVISAALSVVVTRKSLKPLSDITKATQSITVTRLKERLDVTSYPSELSTLAIAFNHMLDRIDEGFSRLSRFSADLAHELRTPINILMGEAELALSRPRSNQEYLEILESSLEEFQRISNLINNLLFLARAENPNQSIVRSWIDIASLFKSVDEYYEAAAEDKQVQMVCQGDGKVYADTILLRRAIINLVSNALQHTKANGLITLSSVVHKDKSVDIQVSDTGNGIEEVHWPHLFDRFYRVESDRAQSTGGTGLGLAIVKSIMDLHCGQITVYSEFGKGTTFTLRFPSI